MAKVKMSKEDLTNLNAAERKLTDVLPSIDDLEACGVDCDPLRQIHLQRMQQIQQLKKRFSPNGLAGE